MWLHESNRKFHTDGTLHSKCPSVRYPGLGGAVPRTCRAERVNAVPAPVPGAAPSLMDQAKAAPDSSIKEAKAEAGQPFTSASKETTEGNNQTKPAGPPPLSLASIISSLLLPNVRFKQQGQGLRHGDYQRYRRYCTRRLARIRRVLKLSHGRKTFVKREFSADTATVTHIEYLLMKAERAWAYAMQLKDEMEDKPRKRFHHNRRLSKAVIYAAKLEELCQKRADSRTCLEAEAYSSYLAATLFLEHEAWRDALDKFIRARTIYDQLGRVGDPEQQTIYKQRVEEIDPHVRYCRYHLGERESQMPQAAGLDQLQAKLENVLEEARRSAAQKLSEIHWRGQVIPIRSEKLRAALVSAQEISFDLEKTQDHEKKMELYDRLFVAFNNALQAIRDDMNDLSRPGLSAKKAAKRLADEATLQAQLKYVTHQKISRTIDRNLLMVEVAQRRFDGLEKGRPPKADDLAKLYENLLQNMNERDDQEQSKEIQAQVLQFKAYRKWEEAIALLTRAGEHVAASRALATPRALQADLQKLDALENRIAQERFVIHARAFAQSGTTETQPARPPSKDLVSSLDKFDASFLDESKLVEFPPEPQPISCRPLLFDLAYQELEFPSLEAKKKQKAAGGLLARLWRS